MGVVVVVVVHGVWTHRVNIECDRMCDVGDYPIVRPGSTYSYISCTHFSTTRGTMHGIYTMRNLQTGKFHLQLVYIMFS